MSRADHIAEMRLALSQGISLGEARRRRARLKWQAGQAAIAAAQHLREPPIAKAKPPEPRGAQGKNYWWDKA